MYSLVKLKGEIIVSKESGSSNLQKAVREYSREDCDFVYRLHDNSTPTGLSLSRADHEYQMAEISNSSEEEIELWKDIFNIILSRRVYELTGELIDPHSAK